MHGFKSGLLYMLGGFCGGRDLRWECVSKAPAVGTKMSSVVDIDGLIFELIGCFLLFPALGTSLSAAR